MTGATFCHYITTTTTTTRASHVRLLRCLVKLWIGIRKTREGIKFMNLLSFSLTELSDSIFSYLNHWYSVGVQVGWSRKKLCRSSSPVVSSLVGWLVSQTEYEKDHFSRSHSSSHLLGCKISTQTRNSSLNFPLSRPQRAATFLRARWRPDGESSFVLAYEFAWRIRIERLKRPDSEKPPPVLVSLSLSLSHTGEEMNAMELIYSDIFIVGAGQKQLDSLGLVHWLSHLLLATCCSSLVSIQALQRSLAGFGGSPLELAQYSSSGGVFYLPCWSIVTNQQCGRIGRTH